MKRVLACVGAVVVVAFGAAACGDDEASQSEAEAQMCTSLESVGTALDGVEGVQVNDAAANAQNVSIKRVQATWSGVEQAARDLNESDADALGSSLDDLEAAAADLDSDVTPAEAKAQLQPHVDEVRSALNEMRDGIQCSS